ncbi:MAG: 50S ribosomal protein L13 [Verrucomicrobiae bacterium]|nr:50S ribosomal protein L13 [Verrucomicrobiae bacterium]
MKTWLAKKHEAEKGRKWYLIDAAGQTVGRIAVRAANILRGRHEPTYTPHVDTGDFVIILNAEKAVFTGKKEEQKIYMSYSGYVGGHHETTPKRLRRSHPERILEKAIKGMIPHTRLGRAQYRKLKVYRGTEHPHEAQKPQAVNLAA